VLAQVLTDRAACHCPQVLREFKETKNCVGCCNRDGLFKFLEKQQLELEMCEKALDDFMESKRRAFPRFYFVSKLDLLDMLSNGNNPHKVMQHMSKNFQVRALCTCCTESS
jgi:dynein heavy chain